MPAFLILTATLLAAPPPAVAGQPDEPRRIAEAYLKALQGTGSDKAKDYLLGGVTLTAEAFSVPNWKILRREPMQREEGDLAAAVAEMRALDKVGQETQRRIMESQGDEIELITREQAQKLLAPTRKQTELFKKKFPLFAYVARVDKEVYWHPKSPWRVLVDQLGSSGTYQLELHLFIISEAMTGLHEGESREWPLRVVRLKTPAHDTGWKILPASDWDPEL